MPVKDLGRVSSCWGRQERVAALCCCSLAGLFFIIFFFFTCSIGLVNHGLYYSSPGVNEPGREKKKGQRRKTNVKSPCIHTQKDSSQATTKTKQFCMT